MRRYWNIFSQMHQIPFDPETAVFGINYASSLCKKMQFSSTINLQHMLILYAANDFKNPFFFSWKYL